MKYLNQQSVHPAANVTSEEAGRGLPFLRCQGCWACWGLTPDPPVPAGTGQGLQRPSSSHSPAQSQGRDRAREQVSPALLGPAAPPTLRELSGFDCLVGARVHLRGGPCGPEQLSAPAQGAPPLAAGEMGDPGVLRESAHPF